MKIKTINIYSFDELSDKAKEKARDYFRNASLGFEFNADCVIDDAKIIAALFGLDIDRVYYSGFYHQGSDASFVGNYQYTKGALKAVKENAPLDTELHRIVKALQDAQKRYFYRLIAECSSGRGHYLRVNVEHSELRYLDVRIAENDIVQALRDFASWIYSNLEKEYEYQTSDEVIDEMIMANEYDFTEDGELA